MDATGVALGLGWLVVLGGGGLWIALRETGDAFGQVEGAFHKWAEHLRGCPARKDDESDCDCGLSDFREALEGD